MQSCSARRRPPRFALALVAAAVAAALLGGCATMPGECRRSDDQRDPLEPLNRHIFAFNLALDRTVIKPVAKAYRSVLPQFVRDGIRAIVDNLKEPLVLVNDLLQGRGTAAGITGRRFIINSTFGLGGLTDRAAEWGLPRQSGDFGQTLFAWGLADGPYLVLPFFGPSNVRDSFGLGVDSYASPLRYVGSTDVRQDLPIATGAADGIDLRSRNIESLDELESSAFDFYAYLRSVTRQQRQSILRQAREPTGAQPGEELVDPGAPAPPLPLGTAGTGPDAVRPAAAAAPCEPVPSAPPPR